jgi:hypothetical protein
MLDALYHSIFPIDIRLVIVGIILWVVVRRMVRHKQR